MAMAPSPNIDLRSHSPPHSLLSQPSVITIAPENIRVVSTGKDWGMEPFRLAGMEYFCGCGILTTDGDIWSRSRKLLKPTFNKSNLADLSFLSTQVDTMLWQLPNNGTTVDLQPLFYAMFLNTSLNFLLGIDPTKDSEGTPHTSEQFINAFHDALFFIVLKMILGEAWKLAPQTKYFNACKIAHEYLDFYVDQALAEAGALDADTEKGLNNAAKLTVLRALSVQTGMMASQETVSSLLGNACFLLSRHPEYRQHLRDEAKDKGIALFNTTF
ncbi:cytochrome P450 [Lentithecium fluviatile CBS 122367]|uniref:Cytochrome P450 n=1 Tax=Lentithecium fluviatile CBS 122367 TaxID=1168545 RepID=A0A6G1IG49_9PLEO|nr:cytochrome P450 [Lentithecium fluviatile CBS 122367]